MSRRASSACLGGIHLRGIAGVGRGAVEGAVFPSGQHQASYPENRLAAAVRRSKQISPSSPPDRRSGSNRNSRAGLASARSARARCRKLANARASMASFFIVAFPWRSEARGLATATSLVLLGPFSALSASSPVRLTDPTISFGNPSCICRIQSCRSSQHNFSCRPVVVLDTAYSYWIVELVLR